MHARPDAGGLEVVPVERKALLGELARATNLVGRARTTGSSQDRARVGEAGIRHSVGVQLTGELDLDCGGLEVAPARRAGRPRGGGAGEGRPGRPDRAGLHGRGWGSGRCCGPAVCSPLAQAPVNLPDELAADAASSRRSRKGLPLQAFSSAASSVSVSTGTSLVSGADRRKLLTVGPVVRAVTAVPKNTAPNYGVSSLAGRLARLGCTLGGSPGIFG